MIKYLGSKKRLLPVLGGMASATECETALDLFTGTTRVAQEFKRRGIYTTCVDSASYSNILGRGPFPEGASRRGLYAKGPGHVAPALRCVTG